MTDQADQELHEIKILLMLLLMKLGTETTEIATVLGKDKAAVSRMVPKRKIKRISFKD